MKNDDPIIGLYGIYGVYNYGCEAIVRGTEIILRKLWPDVHIKYITPRPKDDKKRLKNCDVEIIKRKTYPLLSFQRISTIMAYTVGLPFYPMYNEDLDWIEDCDLVFSIGGDMYTLPPFYKDLSPLYFLKYLNNPKELPVNYKKRMFRAPYNSLIHFGDIVNENQKKFIIWGASIGPFEKSENAKKIFVDHLKKVDLITSREPKTTCYLRNMGIYNNVETCADPAFAVSVKENVNLNENVVRIGVNLSPISSILTFGKDQYNQKILAQANIIKMLSNSLNAEIILIPHVVCDYIMDDDLRHLQSIKTILDDENVDGIQIIDRDLGFMDTKGILATCDIVIAARMHCAINAIEAGVPTIMVAYSDKTKGMANYIYGSNKWVISLDKMTSDELLQLIKAILVKKTYISSFLDKRMEKIKLDTYKPLDRVANLL